MTDGSFKIEEDVALYQAKLVIPDFTRGKKQLHPLEAEHNQEGSECEDVALYQTKLVIPNFNRGKKQLHPLEAEHNQEGSEC